MIIFKIFFYSLALILIISFVIFRLFRYQKNKSEYYLLLFLAAAFFWVFCNALYDTLLNPSRVLFFVNLAMLPGAFLVNLFFLYSLNFPNKEKISLKSKFFILIPSILIGLQTFSAWNVLSIEITENYRTFQGGFLYFELFLNVILFLVLSLKELYSKYKKSKNEIIKKQLKGILLTVVFSFPIAICSNIIFIIFNLPSYVFLGQFATIIFILGVSYVSIKYDMSLKKKKFHYLFLYFLPLFFVILLYLVFVLFFKNTLSLFSVTFLALFSITAYGIINYFFVLSGSEMKILGHFEKAGKTKREITKPVLLSYSEIFKKLETCQKTFFGTENCQLILKDKCKLQIFPENFTRYDFKNEKFWKIISRLSALFYSDSQEVTLGEDKDERAKVERIVIFCRENNFELLYPIIIEGDFAGVIIMSHGKNVISENTVLRLESALSDIVSDIAKVMVYKRKEESGKELEKEVERKTNDLKIVNNELSKMIEDKIALSHMINHQIRGPLSNVMNYLSFFRKDASNLSSGDRDLYISKVIVSADKLKKTTHDLLLILSLEEEHASTEKVKLDLDKMCLDFIEQFEDIFSKKKLKVSYEKAGVDFTIRSSRVLLAEVFKNLFENVYHYSNPGEVKVSLQSDDKGIKLSLKNPFSLKEESETVFIKKVQNRFERGKGAKERNPEGTGLGVPIVKGIVEKEGGEFGVCIQDGFFIIKIRIKK